MAPAGPAGNRAGVRRLAVAGRDPRYRGGAGELTREKRRAEWPFVSCAHNSHPVIIFGPPSMIIRRVWASLGIRLESVRNPAHLIGFINRFMVRVHEPEKIALRGIVEHQLYTLSV